MPPSNVLMGGSLYLIGFFSLCKADGILKELRPLVENKEDISVSIFISFVLSMMYKAKVLTSILSSGPIEYSWR